MYKGLIKICYINLTEIVKWTQNKKQYDIMFSLNYIFTII